MLLLVDMAGWLVDVVAVFDIDVAEWLVVLEPRRLTDTPEVYVESGTERLNGGLYSNLLFVSSIILMP